MPTYIMKSTAASLTKIIAQLSVFAVSAVYLPSAMANSYDGDYDDNNRFHGKGTYTYLNDGKYHGNWNHGQKSGQGKRTWADGTVYSGNWANNTPNGEGTKTYPDGSQYTGNFSNGEKSDHGTITWANGASYSGIFQYDMANGKGICTENNIQSHCVYKLNQKISSEPIASHSLTPSKKAANSNVINTSTASDRFKNTLKKDLITLSKTYTLSDISQRTSDVLFNHNFDFDLMSLPERALWKKRNALFSDSLKIESKHGDVKININLSNYRGLGIYTIDDSDVTVTYKNKGTYQASSIQPSVIRIKSARGNWISGTFELVLFSVGNQTPTYTISNGVFRLSDRASTPFQL